MPVSALHLVNKYNTIENETAPLHKLGGFSWSKAKKKAAKKAAKKTAEKAVKKAAKKAVKKAAKKAFDKRILVDMLSLIHI